MKNHSLAFLMVAALGFGACTNADQRNNRDEAASIADTDSLSDTTARAQGYTADVDLKGDEKLFITRAATAGMAEVEMAKIALSKSKHAKIKEFATLIIKDHTKANADLAKVAKGKGILVPASLTEEQMKHMKKMQELTGRSFDVHYVNMMIGDHNAMEELFGHAAAYTDPSLKNFILNTLPVIQHHQTIVTQIGKDLNISNVNNGDDISNVNPDSHTQQH